MTSRDDLRKQLRLRRRDFADQAGAAQLQEHSLVMAEVALRTICDAARISAYISNGREVNALPALALAHARGLDTALPHIAAQGETMRFLRWQTGDPLQPGPYGVDQPVSEAREIEPDAILAPLVGFDRRGNRIGQGGGFYDRAFARFPDALRIGLAWSVQETGLIPVESWDQPLHVVITEKELIDCRQIRSL